MKNSIAILNSLFYIFASALAGVLLYGCSKTEVPDKQIDNSQIETRVVIELNKDWKCDYCDSHNWEWKTVCVVCGTPNNKYHANFTTTLWTIIKGGGGFVSEISGLNETNVGRRIELPNGKFPSIQPEPWFETAAALKYYNELKSSFSYRFTPDYAAGVDYAWYHTTHILYPGYHDKTKVEQAHTKWELGDARNLKGNKGNGIKDGTQAAINAFVNR